MTFTEIKTKVEKKGYELIIHPLFHKNTLKISWHGCIDDYEFPMQLSEEYSELLEKFRCRPKGMQLKQILSLDYIDKGDYVLAIPSPLSYGKYKAYHTYEANHTYGTNKLLVLYDDKEIPIDISHVDYYYQGCSLYFETILGLYQECLVYIGGDCIYMMSPEGKVTNICYYPDQSESGRVNVNIKDDLLTVEEYVYYDNDHHHGGWDSRTYELAEAYAKINN